MSEQNKRPQDYIPNPCKENWHEMSGDEQKRHCQKCDTHVHNLTGMSEPEIIALREKNGGKLCGSFRLGPSLALGSGIASLALASCAKQEPPLVGMLPAVGHNGTGGADPDCEDEKKDYATPPHISGGVVAGMIAPQPRND